MLRRFFGKKHSSPTKTGARAIREEADRLVSHLEERDWHQLEDSEGRGYMLADEHGRWMTYEDPSLAEQGLRVLPVVGTSYRDEALQHSAFAAGQPLSLIAEPENPHDENAVGVWDTEKKMQVGYIPRELAPPISRVLLAGEQLEALSLWEWRASAGGPRRGIKVLVGPSLPRIRPKRTLTLNARIEGTELTLKGKTDLPEHVEVPWQIEHLEAAGLTKEGAAPVREGSYSTSVELSSWPHGRLRISVETEDDEGWSLARDEEIRWGAVSVDDLIQPLNPADDETQFSLMVDRNLLGSEMEKAGELETAIELYEANIRDGFEGNGPYDRLAIIYRRQKRIEEEIRVLIRAVEVFSAYKGPRTDVAPKLQKFQDRLAKAQRLLRAE